jgi:CubicO group peptidase (beta-lactamase class C family)
MAAAPPDAWRERLLAMKRRNLIALLAALPAAGVPRWSNAAVSIDGLRLAWDYSRQRASDSTVLVWENGSQVFSGGDADKIRNLASITKTLTSIVTHTGGFPLDTLVHTLLPEEWVGDDQRKEKITIRHLMTMTSGLQPHDAPNIADYYNVMLGQPTVANIGTRWAYASLPVDLLAVAMQRQTGKTLQQLFNERVARKIGNPDVATWATISGSTHTRGSGGARMSGRQMARLGQMLLNRGTLGSGVVMSTSQHSGLISHASYLDSAQFQATPNSPFRIPQDSTSPRSYLRLTWSNRVRILGPTVPTNVYFGWGFNEQFLAVFPTEKLVVVRLGAGPASDPAFRVEFFKRVADAL